MTATTRAHEESRACEFDGFEFCSSCHQGMGCGFTKPRKCQLSKRRESHADLESRAISLLTDDQAMASFIRWRTGCGASTAPSLKAKLGVAEYVDQIFQKVPA